MKTVVDVCSGTGGATRALTDSGKYEVVSIDINPKLKPTICADVAKFDWDKFRAEYGHPFFYWASPDCRYFSIAQWRWPRRGVKDALTLVGSCFEAVAILEPKWWLIENPRGRLRSIIGKPAQTIYYSDWDSSYPTQKPTDLWGNLSLPLAESVRRPYIGRNQSKLWHRRMGRDPLKRARVPYGVSLGILRALEAAAHA